MGINSIIQTNRYIGVGTDKPTSEFYPSPRIAVTKLLDHEYFGHTVAEPACGNGAISDILIEYSHSVHSTDLNDWGYGHPGHDFLTTKYYDNISLDAVITNPPFNIPRGISGRFVERGLETYRTIATRLDLIREI